MIVPNTVVLGVIMPGDIIGVIRSVVVRRNASLSCRMGDVIRACTLDVVSVPELVSVVGIMVVMCVVLLALPIRLHVSL